MSLSRKNPKKRGHVKNKKTRGKHTKPRKQIGGDKPSGYKRIDVTDDNVNDFITEYNSNIPENKLYIFYVSMKPMNEDTKTSDKHAWTDYVNELCVKVEKKLDANIKNATAEEKAKETKEKVMNNIKLLRRLNTPGIWEYLWMDWFPEAVTDEDEDDHKKSITYSTTIKQYKDIDALNYGNDGNLKLLFPQNTYQVDTKYNNPFDKILHMISTFESSMYAQTLSAAAFGQTPDGDNDAQKWKDINDKSENASSTILSSTHRVPISKRLRHSKDTGGSV